MSGAATANRFMTQWVRNFRCCGSIRNRNRPARGGGRAGGVPLKVLDVEAAGVAAFDGSRLVLSRPDQHVAWRGNNPPADPLALIDRIRGAAIHAGHKA